MTSIKKSSTKTIDIENSNFTWKSMKIIVITASAFSTAGFTLGKIFQENQSTLTLIRATQDCNEKLEAQRKITDDLKNDYNKKTTDEIIALVSKLQNNDNGK